jgi:anti-anti-sigma factor
MSTDGPTAAALPLSGSITVSADADETVLHLSGEIDAAVVQCFELVHGRYLRSADAPSMIDAADVTFIDPVGLHLLVRCAERSAQRNRPLSLRSSHCVDRLLQLTETGRLFSRNPATASAAERSMPLTSASGQEFACRM